MKRGKNIGNYKVKNIEYYANYYESVIIPDCVYGAHPKSAINIRNRWMIDNTDLIIAYVEHNNGGAYEALKYAKINEKTSFNRIIINTNEIRSIKSELHKGDGIIAKDTFFHTLTLNDGTRIKFTLYAYGKDAEDEILAAIKKLI